MDFEIWHFCLIKQLLRWNKRSHTHTPLLVYELRLPELGETEDISSYGSSFSPHPGSLQSSIHTTWCHIQMHDLATSIKTEYETRHFCRSQQLLRWNNRSHKLAEVSNFIFRSNRCCWIMHLWHQVVCIEDFRLPGWGEKEDPKEDTSSVSSNPSRRNS